MSRVLVIGCGGVAGVAIQKCCQVSEVFTELCIASRTKEKCDALAQKLAGKTQTVITTAQVDAVDVDPGDRTDPGIPAKAGNEHCASLSGPYHYGCLPCLRCQLYGYCQL